MLSVLPIQVVFYSKYRTLRLTSLPMLLPLSYNFHLVHQSLSLHLSVCLSAIVPAVLSYPFVKKSFIKLSVIDSNCCFCWLFTLKSRPKNPMKAFDIFEIKYGLIDLSNKSLANNLGDA